MIATSWQAISSVLYWVKVNTCDLRDLFHFCRLFYMCDRQKTCVYQVLKHSHVTIQTFWRPVCYKTDINFLQVHQWGWKCSLFGYCLLSWDLRWLVSIALDKKDYHKYCMYAQTENYLGLRSWPVF